MDTSTFIERLNEDLGTEYQSIVQYIQHIATINGPEYHSITEVMDNHLVHELQDALEGWHRVPARPALAPSHAGWPEPPAQRVGQAGVGTVADPRDIPVRPD
jgi:hypothetical protein